MENGILTSKKTSIALFLILIIIIIFLLVLSNSTNITKLSSYSVKVDVKPGWNIIRVNWLGTVEISGDIPSKVTIYPLREVDYVFYNKTSAIPNVKQLDYNTRSIMVENIEYLLIFNQNPINRHIDLFVTRYSVTRPYASLSLIAYVLTVVFIALIFIRISKTTSQK